MKMFNDKCDIMCFGAHPDDVEIGMAGSIAVWVKENLKVIIVDLTKGEKSTNGTTEERVEEAKKAGEFLKLKKRYIMEIPDRRLGLSEENIIEIAKLIRRHQPNHIFIPYEKDIHPDHQMTYKILKESIYDAGLSKFIEELKPWKCKNVFQYFINNVENYNMYQDISETEALKEEVLKIHKSQFIKKKGDEKTLLNQDFLERIKLRDQYFGKISDVNAVECYISEKPRPIMISREG